MKTVFTVFTLQENLSGLILKKNWADLFLSLLEFFIQRSFCPTLDECTFTLLMLAQNQW